MAALTLLAACGGGGSQAAAPANGGASGSGVVSTQPGPGGQRILVNTDGMTLYAATQDSASAIKCTGGCLGFWFPLTVRGGMPKGAGIPAARLGTVRRPDNGQTQVTFDGKPLYTFKLDSSAGMTSGDGVTDDFGGTTFNWHAVTVSGSGSGSPSPGGSGGGYGY